MKLRNLMGAFLALAFAAVVPGAVRAEVAPGDIYSINLVENALYGGRVPTEDSPLKIGEKTVVRVRLLNQRDKNTGNYIPWRLALRNDSLAGYEETVRSMMSPDLGLMLGGQPAYATFIEMKPLEGAENAYTDIFFEYAVQSGDLALPAQLMNAQGKPASSEISADYYLKNLLYWKITNDNGVEAVFHFRPEGGSDTPEIPGEPWEPTRYISGVGMGLFVKTIDFDRNYAKPAEDVTDEDIWRIFYAGETETTTLPPSIATEGGSPAERDTVMYVWSDDEKVVAPRKIDGAEEVTDTIGGKTYTRWVLPVTMAKAKSTVSFTLKAVTNTVGKTAHVRMSSSRNLIADDMGVLVTNWVERTIEVTDPPEPYMSINFVDPAGNPISAVTASPDYKQYSAALIVKLNGKAPTVKTKVDIRIYDTAYDPSKPNEHNVTDRVIPADSAARRIGISTSSDPVDQPWGDRVLSVEFNPGETEKTLYVYALDQTLDIDTKLVFVPVEDMTEKVMAMLAKGDPSLGATEYPGTAKTGSLAVNGVKPVITAPEEGTAITGAMAGEVYALDVTVASSYRNLNGQKGKWKLFYKSSAFGDNNWHSLTDQSVDSATGTMTANLTPTVAGKGLALEIYAIDPNGVASDHVKMTIDIEKAKTAWAELDRADGEYAEGNERSAKAKFFISQPSESASPLYAFLRPLNDDASNCVASAAMTTATPSQGVLIEPGDTDSKTRTADIRLLDGRYPKTAAIFEVVICSSLAFDKDNVKSYSPGQVYLNVTNVAPHVESVSMGGADIDHSGAIVADPIAQGVNKTFRISIGDSEPSLYDLEATGDDAFLTQWKFGNESIDWESVYGNPNLASTVTNHTFSAPGKQVVKVRVQDKDMRKTGRWSPEFTFTVEVLNKPAITIKPAWAGKTTYDETDIGANASTFDVELSVAPRFSDPNDKLEVELTVSTIGDATKYSAADCVLSKTTLSFANGVKTGQSFYLRQLDGTSESAAAGFRITAKATESSESKDIEKKTWDAGEIEINVLNKNPEILLPAEQPKDGDKVVAYVTTVGERLTLAWALRDVTPDTNTMSVTWTTSEGKKKTYIQGTGTSTDTVVYTNDVMSGTHEFWFNSSGESKSVTVMAQDKDGGVNSRTIYYSIAASKTLEIVPHGPPSGNGTTLSAMYQDKASGLGAGKVWSKNPATIEDWVFSYNCGLDSNWRIYGAGYTNGEEDVRSDPDFSYTYRPADGKDSFLYAWLQIVQEKDAAKPTDVYLAVVPEHRGAENSGTLINLPAEQAKDGGFAKTLAEAIFAKEYLVSDNMGDINQDGVPDIYVKKYEFGVYGDDGSVAGDDLKAITVANENGNLDEDFLPAAGTSLYGSLIPGLKESWVTDGVEFDAVTEIRGYHEGLNDAPAQAGVVDVTPDRIYAVDGEWSEGECTISYVEYLAWTEFAAKNGLDPADEANWKLWSPERPTDPCSKDTDDDGFEDGYEYYFWYKAHVGYIENGVHKYLTGRAYDPRNPGEGKFIDSATIARMMDPRHDLKPVDFPANYVEDPSSAKTRDTDNDGLPDLLEFEIGTNPFDFDTDGDGLPDGFEIIVAGTDPLSDHTAKDAKHDAARNYDGDAMAFTTVKRESGVLPLPRFIQRYITFATIEEDGDTDGIQWYVETPLDGGVSAFTYTNGTPVAGVKFAVGGTVYVTTNWTDAAKLPLADGRLAVTLDPRSTFAVTNAADAATALGIAFDGSVEWMLLRPTRIPAGTRVGGAPAETVCANASIVDLAAEANCNAAWVYGSEKVNVSGSQFGFLALGRHQLPKGADENAPGAVLAEFPSKERDVAFLHYLVYQQFGFDPRTAWSWKTPLAARWGENSGDLSYADQTSTKLGYAGTATRTRAFTAYDEFLLYSFFLNNGCDMTGYTEAAAEAPYLAKVWMAFCTNPRGVGEPEWASDTHYEGWTAQRDENGCDTDGDGVPDGWELYVMAGPKRKTDTGDFFNFAPPYAAFTAQGEEVIEMPESYFSPFVDSAKNSETDNKKYIGKDMNDGLTEYQEFASTDACAWYDEVQDGETAPYAKTPLLPADWKWLNKFFPTDPWVPDTDDDGVPDNEEGSAFAYATAEDVEAYKADKTKTVYPGCGLNPLSVDTDMDGIPDGWEKQFAGSTVSTNSAWGYIDGMDGTVADAQTEMDGPNRDYDHDGLENWQEYLTGTMRCWRYDDPFTQWGSIPFEAYYYYDPVSGGLYFEPDFEALGIEGEDEDELWNNFWYETLVSVGSPIYNPHLIVDQSPSAQYFSRVDKGWDPNYLDKVLKGDSEEEIPSGDSRYYWFAHRIGTQKYKDAWGAVYGAEGSPFAAIDPKYYVSCSPLCEDTDQDGMDDFYELFHGLNPMLGGNSMPVTIEPCDIVRANKAIDKSGPASNTYNPWTVWPFAKARGTNPDLDVTVYPWRNGLETIDADGDGVRNYVEAIMAKGDSGTGYHGDPSPLWMTDTTYSNSLTRLHYRMPTRRLPAFMDTTVTDRNGDVVRGFTGPGGKKYFFRDFDAFDMKNGAESGVMEIFSADRWKIGTAPVDARVSQLHYDRGQTTVGSWLFSFEENEGYDTDHDGVNDEVEVAGRAHGATDPIDFDDPRRRQAVYFPGENAALQTPAQRIERHPIVGAWYDEEFPFREYTVECWVRPDDLRDATVVERVIWSDGANAGDRELIRRNFQLAIRKSGDTAYWFTKFDSNGTGEKTSDEVAVISADEVVPGVWTHLAATFDGAHLTLYVNGKPSGSAADTTQSRQQPECGAAAVILRTGANSNDPGGLAKTDAKSDGYGFYSYHAILVGASLKSYADFPDLPFADQWCGYALNLYNAMGWRFYRDFFKGYVDEVRIWDGARSITQIAGSMGVRYTAELAKENRAKVYDQWRMGQSRYRKDGNGRDYEGIEPELRYHFSFDSLLAADSAAALAKVPTGFANGPSAPYMRPDGYEVGWWKRVLDAYGSAYAGNTNYVTWIPNTVAHLPRFDGTTIDSAYWSADFAGDKSGTYGFANAAEPYSLWTQWWRGNLVGEAGSTLLRYYLASSADYATTGFMSLFMFTGRNQLCEGCDLLPLGGAFARYCDSMWDGQGPSTTHEITGEDSDNDGLPNWWERYADEQYRGDLPSSVKISWDTVIDYHGMKIAAGEAYLRDLAKGAYGDGNEKIVVPPTKYLQIADEDANGIPDWWANLYGIRGESGLDDHDNDGLPNYVEYLLSEVFDFKVVFNPVRACSVQKEIPDYFYRPAGCQLYVGEIFTDHDLVDDAWEDLYDEKFASRLAWDAFADADQDGWSNRSENRYAKMVLPIVADKQAHYTAADGLVADYPIPTLSLKLSYNGNRQDTVRTAPMAIQVTTDATLAKDPDATYQIGSAADKTAGTGTDSKTGSATATETAMTRTIGKWSNRHAIGTLTPGNIKQNSLALEFCYDPSSIVYSWDVMIVHIDGSQETLTKRGTRAEYDADKRKYGDQNVKLLSTAPDYAELKDLELRTDEKSSSATWIHTRSGSELGTVNLITGEFDLNLGIFKDQFVVNGTNENDYISLEDQTFRIAYTANPSVGLPRELYLGEADTGHVKEGRNTIVAWAETVAADGVWQPGEPYGIVRDVDVSWRGTKAEIELTDLSPVTPRITLAGGSAASSGGSSSGGSGESSGASEDDPSSDRLGTSVEWILQDAIAHNKEDRVRLENNRIETVSLTPESFKGQRIRVVRWLINDVPVRAAGVAPYVVLDKTIETDVRSCFTEADILGGDNAFDIDWKNLYTEVVSDGGVRRAIGGEVTRMCYLIVVGDGDVGWDLSTSTNVVKALPTAIVRKFGENYVTPVAVAPGAQVEETVHGANPTFKWTMDCPEEEGYTAFSVQVLDGMKVIYDSGKQLAPPRNDKGQYEWSAPLYVGDRTLKGEVFEDKKAYSWKVAMYNAKYSQTGGYSTAGRFFMEVQTNGYTYGTANVAVRYYGPNSSYSKKNPDIRVRAYTSPDFTGLPVAAGYVAVQDSVTDTTVTNANCTVVGIPKGTYYLQAFIDSNANGVCDPWETQGYLCTRDGSTPDYLDPTAITFDSKVGKGDLAVIYLEDADTDGDGLPDAWEFAEYGSLTAKGVELLTETKAGEFVVNTNLSGALKLQENAKVPTAGLAGRLAGTGLMSNAGVLALAMGAETEGYDSFAAAIRGYVSPELVEDGVRITSLDLVDGKVSIKVEAETETAGSAWVNGRKELMVWCQVQWKPSLTGIDWQSLGEPFPITVGTEEAEEIDISDRVPEGDSGYFSVKVYKK